MPRGSKEGLLSAICSDDFPAQGKWLLVSHNLNVPGASLVHHLPRWTQRQVDNAWVQLKEPYVVSRGFGKMFGTSAKLEAQAVGTTRIFRADQSEGREIIGVCKRADWVSIGTRGSRLWNGL